MSNEIAVRESTAETTLIALALEQKADPATLSKLMDLQERWEAANARKAYTLAMTLFKQEAPTVIKKSDKVDFQSAKGRTSYNYANLGSIVAEITATLGKHQLSASWETAQDKGEVIVTCHITHSAGHRESVTLRGPVDESGNKNRIQAVGSTVTYLQRYTLLAALGLATGEDDDGRGGVEQVNKGMVIATPVPPKSKQTKHESSALIAEPLPPGAVPLKDAQVPDFLKGEPKPVHTKQRGTITAVRVATGEKNGKQWKKYGVSIDSGSGPVIYGTFEPEIGNEAEILMNTEVFYTFETKGQYKTLLTLEAVSVATTAPPEITDTDLPWDVVGEREPGEDG